MKKTWVRFFLVLFLLIFIQEIVSKPNPSTGPTPTVTQPTPAPSSILAATIEPASPAATLENRVQATVVKVVDGDTIQVNINGTRETIRIIGINTPETVDPRRPIECFGKEASDRAKSLLPIGKVIELEEDLSQDTRDRYNRLLRYAFIDGIDYGGQMIAEGYAYEYTYEIPYRYQLDYKEAQRLAQENKRGLWGDIACESAQTLIIRHAELVSASPSPQTLNSFGNTQDKQVQGDATTYSGDLSGDRDCKDFTTQSQAQSYFNAKGGSATNNVDRLDSDSDGVACESLP